MKILVTGTHFTPAQAVIEELKKYPEVEIVYLGRKHTLGGDQALSVESQVLPLLGVKFYPIITGGLRRFISIGTFVSFLKIPIGFIQSFYIVSKERPAVVLSFGGYVAVPVVIVAWLLSIPIIVHEQTLVTGLANSICNLFADKIAVSFDQDYCLNKEKTILTGNPIRKELLKTSDNISLNLKELIKQADREEKPIIYITGGSQGSHIINKSVEDILPELVKRAFIIHQAGDSKYKDYESLLKKARQLNILKKYLVQKWYPAQDLSLIFRKVNLALSRAGANTLLELSFFGIPTLVIPIAYLHKDEQNTNARYFKKIGLCQILPQDKLNAKTLLKEIKLMLGKLPVLGKQAQSAKSIVIPQAAKKLAQETLILLNSNV